MKAWELTKLGGDLNYRDIPKPVARGGAVVVRIEASVVMSYMSDYVEGNLPIYHAPDRSFIPGGNGVGVVDSVGPDVWHLNIGQRVVLSSHFVAQENVPDAGQILIGVTASGDTNLRVQATWPNGTLAEFAEWPASAVTPVEEEIRVSSEQLAVAMRFVVPYGGLSRGRLAVGETIIISGATGAYGTASVFLSLAMGAGKVIALGRNAESLARLAEVAGPRVSVVALTGDVDADVRKIKSIGGAHISMAFDQVGGAGDANMTLAALKSLGRNGRLVLMGSMTVPLPLNYTEVMMNGWEVIGNFMYPRTAYVELLNLVRSGQLSLGMLKVRKYPLEKLRDAMIAAAGSDSFECVVMEHRQSSTNFSSLRLAGAVHSFAESSADSVSADVRVEGNQ